MQPILENILSKFQTGGVKGKGAVNNLSVLGGLIDHSNYLAKELWMTSYALKNVLIVYGLKIKLML